MVGVVNFFNSKSVVIFHLIQHILDEQNQMIVNIMHHSVMTTS